MPRRDGTGPELPASCHLEKEKRAMVQQADALAKRQEEIKRRLTELNGSK
jgi:hypothetical protein